MNYFKKTILSLISLILLFNISVSSQASDQNVTVSANYEVSDLSLNVKYPDSGSILNWQDLRLYGARVNVEFDKAPRGFDRTNLGIGYSVSSRGHYVDDDSTNDKNVIGAGAIKASSFNIVYDLFSLEDNKFIPKTRVDFTYLKLRPYDYNTFGLNKTYFLEGLTCKYDVYKLGLDAGLKIKLVDGAGYINVSGQAGMGLYFALADWIHRPDYEHPVSFSDIALSLRCGSGLDMGLRFDEFTIFGEAQIFYETSLIRGMCINFLSGEKSGWEPMSFNLLRTSFSAGVKMDF